MIIKVSKNYLYILLIGYIYTLHCRIPKTYVPSYTPVSTNTVTTVQQVKDCCPQPIPLCCPKNTYKPIVCRPRVCRPKIRCYKPCAVRRKAYCYTPRTSCRTCQPTVQCVRPCAPRPIYCRPQPVCCPPKPLYCREKPNCCPKVRCCRPKPPCCPRPLPPCPKPACVQPPYVKDVLPPTYPPCASTASSPKAHRPRYPQKTKAVHPVPQRSLATREISSAELQPQKVTSYT